MFKKLINIRLKSVFSSLIAISMLCCSAFSSITKVFAGAEDPIPVVISFDENYLNPAIVSMTSMLINSNTDTFYHIYALVPGNFSPESREKFSDLEKRYSNCRIDMVDMGEQFQEYRNAQGFSEAAFYRLRICSILPEDIHRCIYVDVDTWIKDLTELYNWELGDDYVAGVPDVIRTGDCSNDPDRFIFGVPSLDHYVNSGVLLWNLDKCRQDGLEEKFLTFLTENWNGHFHDQCIINAVCYEKIRSLPFKFNAQTYFGLDAEYGQGLRDTSCFSVEDWNEGRLNPTVVHYCEFKPWQRPQIYAKEWWQTAKETPIFKEIFDKFLLETRTDYERRLVRSFVCTPAETHALLPTDDIPKVSVIIPVHNSAPWLKKCIQSVLDQTTPVEIICIDDASSDCSFAILNRFASQDRRVKVISLEENGGASVARNAGLTVASGEYIGFVDSDDWIDKRTYAVAYQAAKENDADVVMYGAWCDERPTSEHYSGPKKSKTYVSRGLKHFFPPIGSSMVWDKIYRRDLLNSFRGGCKFDPSLPCTQDTMFNFIVSPHVKRFVTIRCPFYHYTRRSSGLVKTMTSSAIIDEIKAACHAVAVNWPARVKPEVAAILYEGMSGWIQNHSKWAGCFADCDRIARQQIMDEGLAELKAWFDRQVIPEEPIPTIIIISVYNAAPWLRAHLSDIDKFISVTNSNTDVILVNNGSEDDTEAELIGYWGKSCNERIHLANLKEHTDSPATVKEKAREGISALSGVFVDAQKGYFECFSDITKEDHMPIDSLPSSIQKPIKELIGRLFLTTDEDEKDRQKAVLQEMNQWDGDSI